MNLFDLDAVDSGAAKLYLQKWITRGCALEFKRVNSGHPRYFEGDISNLGHSRFAPSDSSLRSQKVELQNILE